MGHDDTSNLWDRPRSRRMILKGGLVAGVGLVPLIGAACNLASTSTPSPSGPGASPSGSSGPSGSTGPASSPSGPPSKPTGTLRVAIPGQPNFIDPSQMLEVTDASVVRNVYDGLLEWNEDYSELSPALATDWTANQDATVWTFKLRSGVTFHDGAVFDSHAARKTVEYYKDKNWGLIFANLASIDDSDPTVLKLSFSKPSPDLARNQTMCKMISPKLIDANAAGEQAVGTGPYKWVSWDKNVGVTLAANENYWGQKPYLETIKFLAVVDTTSAIVGLQAGDIDLVLKVPPRQVQALSLSDKLSHATTDSWVESNLICTTQLPIIGDVRVRQAIMYALDREAICRDILLNQAAVDLTVMPPGAYGYHPAATKYSHDPDKARALLKEAGFATGPTIKMAAAALIRVMGEEVAQATIGQLNAAGFDASLDIMEAGAWVSDYLKSNHPLYQTEYGWTNGGPFHFTLGSLTDHPHWTGKTILDLVDKVRTTPDGPDRLNLLAQLQDQYMIDLPEIPMYSLKLTDVFTAKLKGYRNPKDGYQTRLGGAYLTA